MNAERITITLLALMLPILSFTAQLSDGSSVTVKETVLMALPADTEDKTYEFAVSDDLSRCAVAYINPVGRCYLYYDGKKSPEYDTLLPYFVGKHLCYEAFNGDDSFLGVDGKVKLECEQISASKDGSHMAVILKSNGKYRVEIDGKPGPLFDRIEIIKWMADGRLQYLGYRKNTVAYLINHEERATIPLQGPFHYPKISPDGRRVAYVERMNDDQYMLTVDDKRFGPFGYEKIGALFFSSDSKRYIAEIIRGEGQEKSYQFLVDGVLSPQYHNFLQGVVSTDPNNTFYFSPDSKHVAYAAEITPGAWALVVDGKASEITYPRLSHPIFSADSRHIGCIAEVKDGEGIQWAVLVDGKEQHRFPYDVCGLTFSPDFQRWHVTRVVEHKDGKQDWSVITSDGIEYKNTGSSSPQFTRDSRHMVYLGNNGADVDSEQYRMTVYIDGVRVSEEYPGILTHLHSVDQGFQIVCMKTMTPDRGKVHKAVVRVDITVR